MATDSTTRFSSRVTDYVRYRPSYPRGVIERIAQEASLDPDAVIVDVGSGTGISAGHLLELGATVFAIEPNAAMRAAAEEALGGRPNFRSVEGTAEATRLADGSVDLVRRSKHFIGSNVPRPEASSFVFSSRAGSLLSCGTSVWRMRRRF